SPGRGGRSADKGDTVRVGTVTDFVHYLRRHALFSKPDGAGRTGQQRLQRLSPVGAGGRLGLDEGRFSGLTEDRRSDLPTGIAVDAGRVHEEIAGDVFGHTFSGGCHDRASSSSFYRYGLGADALAPPSRSIPPRVGKLTARR